MKTITTIAAIAALTTLAACGTAEAPAEAPATEVVEASGEQEGGPCGDGTALSENQVCP